VGDPAHERHGEHGTRRRDGYARRQPEEGALYQTVAERWPAFRERMGESGGLPKFVVREFEEFLKCGILEEGCLHLMCRSCGYSMVVALSCKKRGFCPSCLGRRMADTAVHLQERVLPAVRVRHWICSLPWGLRALLGYDRELCAEVVSAFVGELSRSLRRRAKRELGLASVEDAYTGAVCAVQRTDGALRLNVHLHVLALDGVHVRDAESGALVFQELGSPSHAGVLDIARRTAERVDRLLRKSGRSLEREGDEPVPELCSDEPGLASCYAAAAQGISVSGERAGKPQLRLVFGTPAVPEEAAHDPDEPVAEHRGINVHARQSVDGRDRRQLERLCRYVTRPPVAQDRLERLPDGSLELRLKHAWKDGTRAVVLEPDDLLVRLVAAVPPPRWHLLRYFGVLSSHSRLRRQVVPHPPVDPTATAPPPAPGDQLEFELDAESDEPAPRKRWAWLLRHVFLADLDTCVRCGGPMRWVEAAATREGAHDLLARLGLGPRPPPARPFVPLAQLGLPFVR
jgi:Putative transposase/Transposase zinc-binding domain